MKYYQSPTIVLLLTLCLGCTARNTQPDYYGESSSNYTPVPQRTPNPGSSTPILEAPGSSNSGGPTLLTPEPDLGPAARRRTRPQIQPVGTDPWGRPQNRRPRVQNTVRTQVQHRTLWDSQYQSTQQRQIQTVKIGIGRTRVLVLSSLRGTDPASITVIEYLAQAMSNEADLQNDCTALFVRNPNPDGIAQQSLYNARGIDLTRNFPAENWRRTADGKAGPNAASEIETRVLIRLIDDFKPDRIVIVQNSASSGAVNYAGPARQLARKVAAQNGYQVTQDSAARSGSLEQFAGTDRRLSVVALSIDRRLDGKAAWSAHANSLKTALTYHDPRHQPETAYPAGEESEPTGPVAESKGFPLPLNIIKGSPEEKAPRSRRLEAPRPSQRKYYELPPPGR